MAQRRQTVSRRGPIPRPVRPLGRGIGLAWPRWTRGPESHRPQCPHLSGQNQKLSGCRQIGRAAARKSPTGREAPSPVRRGRRDQLLSLSAKGVQQPPPLPGIAACSPARLLRARIRPALVAGRIQRGAAVHRSLPAHCRIRAAGVQSRFALALPRLLALLFLRLLRFSQIPL